MISRVRSITDSPSIHTNCFVRERHGAAHSAHRGRRLTDGGIPLRSCRRVCRDDATTRAADARHAEVPGRGIESSRYSSDAARWMAFATVLSLTLSARAMALSLIPSSRRWTAFSPISRYTGIEPESRISAVTGIAAAVRILCERVHWFNQPRRIANSRLCSGIHSKCGAKERERISALSGPPGTTRLQHGRKSNARTAATATRRSPGLPVRTPVSAPSAERPHTTSIGDARRLRGRGSRTCADGSPRVMREELAPK
jgi:hypothetical protein